MQPLADAVRGVDQDPDPQRQVGLAAEVGDGLRFVVLKEAEVALGKVEDHAVLLVPHRKQDVDQVDRNVDGGYGVRLRCGQAGLLPIPGLLRILLIGRLTRRRA